MPDHSAEIARLQKLLSSGATTVTVDGQTTTFSEAQIRRRLAELQAADTSTERKPRRRVRGISLRNAF